jgi:hypothetical protein
MDQTSQGSEHEEKLSNPLEKLSALELSLQNLEESIAQL